MFITVTINVGNISSNVNDTGKPFTVTSIAEEFSEVLVYVIVPGGASTPVVKFLNEKYPLVPFISVEIYGSVVQVPS